MPTVTSKVIIKTKDSNALKTRVNVQHKFQSSKSTQRLTQKFKTHKKDLIPAQKSNYDQVEATTHRICPLHGPATR